MMVMNDSSIVVSRNRSHSHYNDSKQIEETDDVNTMNPTNKPISYSTLFQSYSRVILR